MDTDKREMLKSMLNNLIHDKREEADMDLHNYLTAKMKSVAGISGTDQSDLTDDTPPEGADALELSADSGVDETD